jgi:hypothetical protein
VPFTAFTGRRTSEHVDFRLIVCRVKRHQQLASDGTEQGGLFATHRHHAFIANSTLSMIEADERHRDHAIIEQTIAELKEGALAHLPSGKYTANAAWVACAVLAFNLARHRRGRRHGQGTLGQPAQEDHQDPRPDRDHRTTPRPAPAPTARPRTQSGRAGAGRRTSPAHPPVPTIATPKPAISNHHRLIRAQSTDA